MSMLFCQKNKKESGKTLPDNCLADNRIPGFSPEGNMNTNCGDPLPDPALDRSD